MRAPLRVPVELRGPGGRWFRLAEEVGEDGVTLGSRLPDELDGNLGVSFHLPHQPQPLSFQGRGEEVVVGSGDEERAERRSVRFLAVDEASRARISAYVLERLGPNA